jgi:type I restriction enzyme M protein
LRFAPGALNAAMQWVYKEFGANWTDDQDCDDYGVLTEQAIEIRAYLKSHFSELKEAQIKDLLDSKIWINQKQILLKARQLQQTIGSAQHDDMNDFEVTLKAACKTQAATLDTKEKKQITDAVSWKNPAAEKVIKKIHTGKANPLYGLFALGGKVIEYQADTELRDNENVALDPSQSVNALNEAYFIKEVQPHVPDAWIDASKKDDKDQEIGIVGYEIPFNRHFYQYQPPRDLIDIDADLDKVSAEIMQLLQEVHS